MLDLHATGVVRRAQNPRSPRLRVLGGAPAKVSGRWSSVGDATERCYRALSALKGDFSLKDAARELHINNRHGCSTGADSDDDAIQKCDYQC